MTLPAIALLRAVSARASRAASSAVSSRLSSFRLLLATERRASNLEKPLPCLPHAQRIRRFREILKSRAHLQIVDLNFAFTNFAKSLEGLCGGRGRWREAGGRGAPIPKRQRSRHVAAYACPARRRSSPGHRHGHRFWAVPPPRVINYPSHLSGRMAAAAARSPPAAGLACLRGSAALLSA